jgi:hypothetical protein
MAPTTLNVFGVAASTRETDLQNLTRVPRFWRINRPPKIKNFRREFLDFELILVRGPPLAPPGEAPAGVVRRSPEPEKT